CINCKMTDEIEVDKLITTLAITGSTIGSLVFQSSSVDLLAMIRSNIHNFLGTPKKAMISDSTIAAFYPGALAFGRSDEVVCTNCVINQFGDSTYHTAGGVLEKGPGDNGVNNSYSMNDGVIIIPNGSSINAAADNGSGKVRLTVQSTAGLISGNYYLV